MTYETFERSDQDGQPIRLYLFTREAQVYRYTSAESDIVFDGETWATYPGGVTDEGVQQIGPSETDQFVVRSSWDFPVAELFRGTPPSSPVNLTVRRLHIDDDEAPIIWIGRVINMRRPSSGSSELICESLVSTFRGNGLRLSWGRNCPHMLYDSQCRVDKTAFAHSVTIASTTGTTVTAPEIADKVEGYFDGGFLEWEVSAGTLERRAILTHVGDTVEVLGQTDGLEAAMVLTAYPGCLRDTADCNGKFNNLENYGGCPHLPGKSPFIVGNPLSSTSVFATNYG